MGTFGNGPYGSGNFGEGEIMAVGLASSYANDICDYILGGGAPTSISAVPYIKLHTGDPGSAGTSNAATETTRQQASFAAASGGSATSNADISWTNVAATETYSHYSAWDDSTAGNFLFSDSLTSSESVNAGDTFTISSGSLVVNFTPVAA